MGTASGGLKLRVFEAADLLSAFEQVIKVYFHSKFDHVRASYRPRISGRTLNTWCLVLLGFNEVKLE